MSHRFILFGGGSGNVYGVSDAASFEEAWKEILAAGGPLGYSAGGEPGGEVEREWPEFDDMSVMLGGAEIEKKDGYWLITARDSDEGQFGLLDAQSANSAVQKEIEDLGLQKYADEFVAEKAALDAEAEDEMHRQAVYAQAPQHESVKAAAKRLVDALLGEA
jgi:hypothetical protein